LSLDPQDLLAHADALIGGQPTQTDLRRAISAAYYAVFHFVLAAAADMVAGAANRAHPRYTLVYRSTEHKRLRTLCAQSLGQNPNAAIQAYVPAAGLGSIADFARITVNLQGQRERADYDLSLVLTVDEARTAIDEARQAIAQFQAGSAGQRKAFLTLLLFQPR
jgi:hypothetical protein